MKAVWVFFLVGLAGCGYHSGPSLKARSAGDMHCAPEALRIYRLDQRSYRVVGCQQEAVYIAVCEYPRAAFVEDRNCTWVMDVARKNASEPVAAPTPAPAAGCSFDTQCKGDRICSQGQCASPLNAPPPAVPPLASSSAPAP